MRAPYILKQLDILEPFSGVLQQESAKNSVSITVGPYVEETPHPIGLRFRSARDLGWDIAFMSKIKRSTVCRSYGAFKDLLRTNSGCLAAKFKPVSYGQPVFTLYNLYREVLRDPGPSRWRALIY